jgi:ABC-type sugar transport system substrate-binding protein
MDQRHYTIGYINLSSRDSFTRKARASLEAEAARYPNLTLIVRESEYDSQKTLTYVNEFAEIPVDLAIIFQIDELLAPTLATILTRKKIRIIAQDIHIPMQVYFGINNKRAGFLAGEALGQWIQTNWNGHIDRILILSDTRIVKSIRERLENVLVGLSSVIPNYEKSSILFLDSESTREKSAEKVRPVLENWQDYRHIAVAALNDDSGIGVLDTARLLGRESDVVIVGQGGTLIDEEFRNPNTRFIASTVFYPEQYGPRLIDLALRMLRGERVPHETFVEPTCITPEIYLPTLK